MEAKGAQWEPISAPAMPIRIVDEKEEHGHFIAAFDFPFNDLAAEQVSKTQAKQIPKAEAARVMEWDKLLLRIIGDPTTVKEWSWVSPKSKTTGVKVNVAKIFEMCVVRGADVDDKDRRNIFKGRAVLDGSWVKDEKSDVAFFNAMGSPPASMQAGKAVDAVGLQPEFDMEQADAEASYTQCDFKWTETRVRLPEDRWPD